MRTSLTIILTLFGFLTFGQDKEFDEDRKLINKIEPGILNSLYVIALNNRIDLLLQSGCHYIELNEYGSRIKNLNVPDIYKFLTIDELIDLSIKEKRPINVLRVVHNVITKDTVDINFGYIEIKGKRKFHFYKGIRFKKAEIIVYCGGTNGYQPDIRFVCESLRNKWKIIQNRFIKTNEE